ncbi:SUMF1/EgtB/PvdO family nonheme iron enzyme [Nostoc sp. UHCC 0870]|uniref:SUMF1/EgtB/PvdO family nonheme iron enzyme n=1 Tax=Nostoc sp. UHCC 0870 TaxID=2914041 RepID=UPI001EDF6FD5|nr:SUMF1/EgtB/PvdO family nonheme iron enzyme [Nostoc sp. UHCC 0870]UKO98536.1 SUMF1/EgtB/PvdO family nonheme iron enzyme [Nostoc sp. UHCC 0870]
MSEPPLLNLFLRLREAGLPLGIDQYDLAVRTLLQSVEVGLDIGDKQAVKQLCQTIWVKSRQQQRLFDKCWNEMISHPARLSESTIIKPPVGEPATPTDINKPEETKPVEETEEPPKQEEEAEFVTTPISDNEVVTSISTKLKERDYFPVSRDKLRRSWRLLTQKLPSSIPSQIDIPNTVIDIAKRGFFVKPVLTPAANQYREVVLLIDQNGSMSPFHPFCRQLVEIWRGAKIYYFHNVPTEIYSDSQCEEAESIKSMLARCSKEKTLVVIVSDAGAARLRVVPERWEATGEFLAMLTPHVKRVAWLNPLPCFHWQNTTAEFIAQIDGLKMFALEVAEYQQMLQWLLDGKPVKILNRENQTKTIGSFKIWEIGEYNAQGKITAFEQVFGKEHLDFAFHAAFPLVLTPDLLYCLWKDFFQHTPTPLHPHTPTPPHPHTPTTLVSDLLLSDLCREVETELYEMEREVRNELLRRCQEEFGENRLQELSEFLLKYIEYQVKKQNLNVSSDLHQVQQWTALAYTQKGDAAARKLAEKLRLAYLDKNHGELVRLSAVIETLAEPLKEKYEPLLVVSRGYRALVRGDEAGTVTAQDELERRFGVGETVNIAGVVLERPVILGKIRLKPFSFEVVTVNGRGEIIHRERKEAKYFAEDLGNGVSLEMVQIPGGTFTMGSPEGEKDRKSDESPQRQVTVPSFFMGKYPVTQEQYQAIMGTNPSKFKDKGAESHKRPVEQVIWDDAVKFCEKLSQKTGKTYRLPSEAEWEYACRAGTTTPFYFGETITTDLVNYDGKFPYGSAPKGEYRRETTNVGIFPPNSFGLYDMCGNICEWCEDVYNDSYQGAPIDGSAWLTGSNNDIRLLRGGSWIDNAWVCRSANRYRLARAYRSGLVGFRVVAVAVA